MPDSDKSTKDQLIAQAMRLFGQKGFEGTSTREVARAANANIGSIAYYFGGKDGLRMACAELIGGQIGKVVGFAMDRKQVQTPEEAAEALEEVLRGLLRYLSSQPDARDKARFILRELSNPGMVLDMIYNALFLPMHKRACGLWALATGAEAESEETRIAVFSLIGQAVYFLIAQPIVLPRMEWERLGPEEAETIGNILGRNLQAAIRAAREQHDV